MAFEGLDAGDETRRNGDYVGFPHPDADGTSIDSLTIDRGELVFHDGSSLQKATADTDEVIGVLANYDVYGDTGQEEVKGDANVKLRGEVLVDFTDWAGTAPAAGTYLANAGADILPVEEVDADDNLWRVQVQ